MTESQRVQLREIIDLNWEVTQEANIHKKMEMAQQLSSKKMALRNDMGHEEYEKFMDNGRKMFAPKQD
jgi:hypothetical protein